MGLIVNLSSEEATVGMVDGTVIDGEVWKTYGQAGWDDKKNYVDGRMVTGHFYEENHEGLAGRFHAIAKVKSHLWAERGSEDFSTQSIYFLTRQ